MACRDQSDRCRMTKAAILSALLQGEMGAQSDERGAADALNQALGAT
jgi:hypothetical protein